ncbi:hypothetical protein BS17DRAFT_778193 [Gyrodon lividus]|nr:hypothetical protein BS17DRAFT_778193 [Gyrodon lividus]
MSTSSYAFQSPSVSDEKGAYRMRAPRSTRPGSNLRHHTNTRQPEPLSHNRQLVVLVAVLTFAMFVCFGTAYYLFTTRWNSKVLSLHVPAADDITQVVLFDESDTLLERLRADPTAKFLAYLPHSGFHNQRIAFENALVLSRLLNRTLLVPPVRLGGKTIRYVQFDELRHLLTLGGKEGLQHCADVPRDTPTPDECIDYFDYTLVPWASLVNLTQVKAHQRLLRISNFTSTWLFEKLNISEDDTLVLADSGPYDFRFLDSVNDVSPSRHKYLQSVYIPDLVTSQQRLLQIGTLFGSSRLRLKQEENKWVRRDVRRSMAFANADLTLASDLIHDTLGGVYLGAHVRVGDGRFQRDGRANARVIWWKLVQGVLGLDLQTAVSLEQKFLLSTEEEEEMDPPHIYPDLPSLRVPHPPLPPLPEYFSPRVSCQGRLHRAPSLRRLNVPLFVATDCAKPRSDPLFVPFFETFPCVFFLSDFRSQTAHLDRVRNAYDGVAMKLFLLPLLDAMIAGKAHQVVVTDDSTFSAFIQDVLWRTYHGWEIVQRG